MNTAFGYVKNPRNLAILQSKLGHTNMALRAITIVAVLMFCTATVFAADPFAKGSFDAKAYDGELYEPRYCNPAGPLPMSTCVMANLNMAEDYMLRVAQAKASELDTDTIRRRAKQPCDEKRKEAVKRYRTGDLIDVDYWSCIRREYHQAAQELLK